MLEVTATNRPTAAMVLEDTWLCTIIETPSKKMRNRQLNRERCLDGEVQVHKGGNRRLSSNWSHSEDGRKGRRRSREDMDKLLNTRAMTLRKGSDAGPTPSLTPSLSLISVEQTESVPNSQRISADNDGVDMNDQQQSGTRDAAGDADCWRSCLPVSDSVPHQSAIPPFQSAMISENAAQNGSLFKASQSLSDTEFRAGIGLGAGAKLGLGLEELTEAITKFESGKTVKVTAIQINSESAYGTVLDVSTSRSTTSSTLSSEQILQSPHDNDTICHPIASTFPVNGVKNTLNDKRHFFEGNMLSLFEDVASIVAPDCDSVDEVDEGSSHMEKENKEMDQGSVKNNSRGKKGDSDGSTIRKSDSLVRGEIVMG